MNEIVDKSTRFRQVCQLLLSLIVGAATRETFTVVNFYHRKLEWCVRPDLPEINLPWEISMVTSKRRKKPPMTFSGNS